MARSNRASVDMEVMNMGLFDSILGKKSSGGGLDIEPCDGGYVIKNPRATAPKYNMACIFFDSPVANELEAVTGLAKEQGFSESLAPGTLITTAYEAIPDLDEYLSTQEMPDSLNAFLMTRAMMKGLARSQAEMGKLTVYPFQVKGSRGVVVLKEI